MTVILNRFAATRLAVSALALMLVAGCATPPPAEDAAALAEFEEVNDPLEPMNRAVFDFNQAVDKALLKPLAQGYRAAVPEFGRDRVRDFLNNLRAPLVFVNDLLQGEPDRAVETLMRFAFNSSFGIAGLFDIATEGGIAKHSEDLGQTFAVWGISEGPYLVLPILGPSNPRDALGIAGEAVADPFNIWWDNAGAEWAIWTRAGIGGVDKREGLLDTLDDVEKSSIDYYSALRSLYRQRREAEIRNEGENGRATPNLTSSVDSPVTTHASH